MRAWCMCAWCMQASRAHGVVGVVRVPGQPIHSTRFDWVMCSPFFAVTASGFHAMRQPPPSAPGPPSARSMVSGRMKVTTTTAPSAVLDSPRSERAAYESPLYESPPLERWVPAHCE